MSEISRLRPTVEDDVRLYTRGPRVVAIGGGHGLSTMLRGLKNFTRDITAVVTVADDGGGSGVLRQDLGMLPPGDARDCIVALSNTEPEMRQLMTYRFQEGSLAGQSMGNLILAAMNGIYGTFADAVYQMGQLFSITGRVLPVTEENIFLQAEFDDGTSILGESAIFYHKKDTDRRIRRVALIPENPKAYPAVLTAIRRADLILIGPGSLYTSIIPNFLVEGITDAVREARGYKLMVLNLMTQDGETEGYTAADHIREFVRHSAPGCVQGCLANDAPVPEHLQEDYRREGAEVLRVDEEEIRHLGVDLYTAPLLSNTSDYARHDPMLLASAIMEVYKQARRR